MGLSQLNERERTIVRDCLRATCEGPFFPDREFFGRFGQQRTEVYSVLRAWPKVDDSKGPTALAIVNAMANLLSYPHDKPEERRRWVSASDEEILRVLHKWQGKPASKPTRELQRLGDTMAGVSEACYAAGWYQGTEYLVPALCRRALETGQAQPWARGEVTPAMAQSLDALAKELGHWANLKGGGSGYVPFDPFPTPAEHLAELAFWKKKRGV